MKPCELNGNSFETYTVNENGHEVHIKPKLSIKICEYLFALYKKYEFKILQKNKLSACCQEIPLTY